MLAIHANPGYFSDRWIEYCDEHGIGYRLVDCLASDAIAQLDGSRGLLWQWLHFNPAEMLIARQLIAAIEEMGVTVFPNTSTCAHFDDKIAQKYLLEAIGAPLAPVHVFYDRAGALAWIEIADFPQVFKLRCGAGAQQVKLVRSRGDAKALCRKAFGRGFSATAGYFNDSKRKLASTSDAGELLAKLKRMPATLRTLLHNKRFLPVEKGYLYFQEFQPDNGFDTRVTVIGDRAFSFLRHNRPGDFRASGSGSIDYDPANVDERCVEIAFEVTERLGAQSLAFDFVFSTDGQPLIVEISYTYDGKAILECPGYRSRDMSWHEGEYRPEDLILLDLLDSIGEG